MQADNLANNQKKVNNKGVNSSDEDEEDDTADDTVTSGVASEVSDQPLSPLPSVKKWFEEKREGSVLLKVSIANKGGDTLTA